MNKTDILKSYLPDFLLISPIIQNLFEQYGNELENLDASSIDLLLQLFPQTATWGIRLWEQLLNLPVNEDLNLIIRRNRVISKLAVLNPMNYKSFSTIISKFAENTDVIQNFSNYSLDIKLITKGNFNVILNDIAETIENIKPAHLGYLFNLETQKSIKIASIRTYAFNPLNMCGQFNCGDSIVISSYGRVYSANSTLHGDCSKNIKDYSLTGTILNGTNSEFESGIATIGRVYSSSENINVVRDYLYDSQLSKTDGYVIGSLYAASIQAVSSYNNAVNTYDEAGNDLAGQLMTGSVQTLISTLGRLYQSNDNIQAKEEVIFDSELSKSSLTASIVGSLNTSILQAQSSSEDGIKDYSLTGFILASTNIGNESGDTTIGKTYSTNIQENSDETNSIKEYNQAGDILTSTEVVV